MFFLFFYSKPFKVKMSHIVRKFKYFKMRKKYVYYLCYFLCRMLYVLCLMFHVLCLMSYVLCLMSYVVFLMSYVSYNTYIYTHIYLFSHNVHKSNKCRKVLATEWMNESLNNDKSVCRIAPATPGLLKRR